MNYSHIVQLLAHPHTTRGEISHKLMPVHLLNTSNNCTVLYSQNSFIYAYSSLCCLHFTFIHTAPHENPLHTTIQIDCTKNKKHFMPKEGGKWDCSTSSEA
uniref:Uncharacterized protein n=1 Tax=Arundo donax TaxID=35708 RepID=A0A0A9HGM2_ARUDO